MRFPFSREKSSPFSLDSRFAVAKNVTAAASNEELVLCDFTSGRYIVLNNVAGSIWRLVGSGASGTDVIAALRQEFPDAPPTLEAETQELLRCLVKQSLLTRQ